MYVVNTTYMPCRELLCRCSSNIYACWPSVTFTNTTDVQTCLLIECCCKIDACWTVATQSACLLTFCHSIMHVCWLLYLLYLLVWCLTISRVCWYGVSLSAMPAGVVLHYRSFLLFGTSLSAMPVGVVPHFRSCLLVWCLTIGHVF